MQQTSKTTTTCVVLEFWLGGYPRFSPVVPEESSGKRSKFLRAECPFSSIKVLKAIITEDYNLNLLQSIR